jgi:hypothetical protein
MLERFLAGRVKVPLCSVPIPVRPAWKTTGTSLKGPKWPFTEGEEITGVSTRYRNGMSFLQAADLVCTAMAASGRDTIIMHEHT